MHEGWADELAKFGISTTVADARFAKPLDVDLVLKLADEHEALITRMLSNPRFLGLAFGRKRNRWSSKRDYNQQVDGPETEVAIYRCEDLRILDDELFHAVQARLAEFKLGPRGPHKRDDRPLGTWSPV